MSIIPNHDRKKDISVEFSTKWKSHFCQYLTSHFGCSTHSTGCKRTEMLWLEIFREVVRCDLNGSSGSDDRGTVYHDHSCCWKQLSGQMWSAEAVSPSSLDWQARPDSGDGYYKGQLNCRKPVVQAVFSQPHYSRQVDPGNCSSDELDSKALIV